MLLERDDFAKGTSSRSTKLVHGGVRYLEQGNISLVFEALRERGILLQNAPHLVRKQSFIIPLYSNYEKLKYYTGLKIYDWLAGYLSFGSSKLIGKKEIRARLPTIKTKLLKGGVEYFDGQFDDARLAINLAQTSADHGAIVLNYCSVVSLDKENEKLSGVVAVDLEEKKEYHLKAKTIINATGVFVDDILKMDHPANAPIVRLSQGAHIVVDKSFLQAHTALLVPKTPDGRVLFAVPWHNHVLIGTTDVSVNQHSPEPKPLDEEIEFILDTIKQYLVHPPYKKDILSSFAGLRPLAIPQTNIKSTKEISRDHKVLVSDSNLITITGGKWTTYRRMAEDVLNTAIKKGLLDQAICKTKKIRIHGFAAMQTDEFSVYGSDAKNIKELISEHPERSKKLVEEFPYTEAEVVWATRNEMARTIEDIIARRLRILFLNANAAIKAAPRVAALLQKELNRSDEWKDQQLRDFIKLAHQYLPS